MAVLIAYATKYGCAEKCARMLAERLKDKAELCDLKTQKITDLTPYDTVIVGGSMYMGSLTKETAAFCRTHMNELKQKKVGLFICGMAEGELRQKEIEASFPGELRATALAVDCFGGECIISKLKPFHKFIFTKVAKTTEDKSNLSEEAIAKFADVINRG